MSRILTITLSALVLAGCAGDYGKSAGANCKRPPDQQAQWDLVTPGVVSLGMDVHTKKQLGIDSSNRKAANTIACVHNEDNKGNGPNIHDLQKIGAAVSSAIEPRHL